MPALLHKVSYPRGTLALSSLLKYDDTTTVFFLQSMQFNLVKLFFSILSGRIRTDTSRTTTMKTRVQWTILTTIADVIDCAREYPTRSSQRMSPDCLVTGGHPRIDLPRLHHTPNVPVLLTTITRACANSVVQSVAET